MGVRCASVSPSPQSPPTGGGEVILGNRMGKYLIIGCGYFGSRAAEKLLRKDPKPKIIVVDRNKEAVNKVSNLPAETFTGDGPVYLGKFFSEGRSTDHIIPAVPFHLVFEFILSQLKTWGAKKKGIPPFLI